MTFAARVRTVFIGALIAAAVAAWPVAAQSPDAPRSSTGKVAVINLEKIKNEAAMFKNIREQVDAYRAEFRSIIQAEEDELRKADQELARQRAILSPEAYAEERRNFEKRVVEFQRQGERMKRSLEQALAVALNEANRAIKQVVDEFAERNEITLVLLNDKVAFYDPAMDITPLILEPLNQSVPTIKVPKPER